MKTLKITYWAATVIVAGMMSFSAFLYLTKPEMVQGFQHLGYPDHVRIALALAKFTGAILLLLPWAGSYKEWAYAGFTFTFVAAFLAHSAAGDPTSSVMGPVLFMGILAVSYVTYHKLQQKQCVLHATKLNELSRNAA